MKYDKPFLTYHDQILLLKERGLIIKNEAFAIHALNTISYYDLINRYKIYFMDSEDCFKQGISIEYLYLFSLFDHKVQAFILKYSGMIETLFKTRFAYVLSEKYGVDKNNYLNPSHYEPRLSSNGVTFKGTLDIINNSLDPYHIKNPSKYYSRYHNHIPAWILFKNISLGNSINLFRLLNSPVKRQVVDALIPYSNLQYDQKSNYITLSLNAIREFRNCVAHNLNFTNLRITGRYKIPSEILWDLMKSPLVQREKKKVTKSDKDAFQGIYGVMLAILSFLDNAYLRSLFIQEFLVIISSDRNEEMFNGYAQITKMLTDIKSRFSKYYQYLQKGAPL